MKKEQKCKDEDDYKDYDKEKDAKRIIETLGVCYILGILMTQAFQVWWWKPPLAILVFLVTHIFLVALVTHIVLVALVTLATLVTLVILVLWSSWST